MAKIRVNKTTNYTIMSNVFLRDKRLSLKAKGLLALMFSLPEEWNYSVDGLTTLSADGKDSIATAITELEKYGYLIRTQAKDNNGKFAGYVYDVYEEPQAEIPFTENPSTVKPITENRPQINTYILNKEEVNKEDKHTPPYNPPKSQGGQKGGQKVEKIPLHHTDELNCDITPYYIEIINYLNAAIGTKYRYQSKLTQRLINARFKEGYTVDDFKTVIDKKAKEWKGTEMEQFLRPETLFGTKFESYLNAPIKSRSICGAGNKTQHFENEREYSTNECNNLLKDIDDINF